MQLSRGTRIVPPVRILDIDLDFFVEGTASDRDPEDDRLDADEFPPWELDRAIAFLEDRCLLSDKRPGFVVEDHSDLFYLWGEAIERGQLQAPFHVTHVDAHADLGQGDSAWTYIVTELLFKPVEDRYRALLERRLPREGLHAFGHDALGDGNWLAFALACHWIDELIHVFNGEGNEGLRPGDIFTYWLKDFDRFANEIELPAAKNTNRLRDHQDRPGEVEHFEPPIPFQVSGYGPFRARAPFDVVCLTRSPAFTPAEADPIFDVIRSRFIDESVFA